MSDAAQDLLGKAWDKMGEALGLSKEAACAMLQQEGLANIRWQKAEPSTPGAVAVPEPTLADSAKSMANAVVAKVAPEKQAFPNPYKDLSDEQLNLLLAKAFDGKTEDGITFKPEELGHLRATAAERNIKAVAPDRDCTLNDLRIGR